MKPLKEEDPGFQKILDYLLKSKGFDGNQYKQNYVKRRVAVRMRATGTHSYSDYLNALLNNQQEPTQLLDRLTIHVTEFFRDPDVYRAVKEKILPELSGVSDRKIKVWCAGCSSGEEPYSVAMMLKEWAFSQPGLTFEIFATDIDLGSVRTAEKGEYPAEAIRKLSKVQTTRWFYLEGARARVVLDLKKHIHFRVHDLISEWGGDFSGFHLIFCRNLLIYLTSGQQQKIYEQFARALAPEGHLILGLTETLMGASRKYFRCVDIRHRIYRRIETSDEGLNSQKEKSALDG